jgi:Ca2+-binding EF-hand superfamily protein
LFKQFDTTQNGQIDLKEFLQQLRPPVNQRREKAIWNLFQSIDMNKDGQLTVLDLKVETRRFYLK